MRKKLRYLRPFSNSCMGRDAISNARLTEACRSDAKVLDPVVLDCGLARLAAREVIELVLLLMKTPLAN